MADTNVFGAAISPAHRHSISDMIDGSLSGTSAQYQFPEDRPKYYTTLKFSEYGTPISPGSIGGSLTAFKAQVKSNIDAIPAGLPGSEELKSGLQSILDGISQRDTWLKGLGADPNTSPQVAPRFTAETVILPLPVGLTDVHKVHWDEKSIVPWLSSLIGQALVAPVTSVGGLFGLAPNFFQTVLFDRPEFKRHELAFKLSPRNFREAIAIKKIIWVLNNSMSPSVESGGLIFGFPNIVQVKLKPNNGWLFKFKPAVIETVAINYCGGDGKKAFYHSSPNADSGDSFSSNPPESVEVTLHLIEIEYWIQKQFTLESD